MSTPDTRAASPSPLTSAPLLVDEDALKRIFNDEFAGSLAAAKSQLGDAAALAPRVVEHAFLDLWSRRDTISNHDDLRAALADTVKHESARSLSKRSAGARFGAVGGAHAKSHVNGEDAESPAHVWESIHRTLQGPAEGTREATAAVGRHEAAAHMKAVTKRPGWVVPVVIGVFALVISVGGVAYFDRLGEDDGQLALVMNQSIPADPASGPGQIGSTNLGDGTKMTMGPESKIFIPDGFATKHRTIRVEGTAAFDVAPGQAVPFRVVARRNHFIATGTRFVISTFNKDTLAMVLVQEGTVTIKTRHDAKTVTGPAAMVADTNGIRAATDDERAEAFSWVDKRVVVRNKELRDVIASMGRWFNYDIKVPDTPLLSRIASIDVPLDSSMLAITQVEKSANVKFGYEGESKVFRDATPGAAKPGTKKK